MSDMDIPEDVWKAARSWVPEFLDPSLAGTLEAMFARAILEERERIATILFNREAFMTAVTGDGDPYVKIAFKSLSEMQGFHREMAELSKAAIRTPNTRGE